MPTEPEIILCADCGCPAEYNEAEGPWRHKGRPNEAAYQAQTFCVRYGYPVRPRAGFGSEGGEP